MRPLNSRRFFDCLPLYLSLLLACSPPETGIFGFCSDLTNDAGALEDTANESTPLTYEEDIKAIVDKRCTRCHQEGGMAPFSLASYEDVYANKLAAKRAVLAGHMPPWQPAVCCSPLEQDWSMPPVEQKKFIAWIDQGARPGNLSNAVPSLVSHSALSRVDLVVKMPEPYRPQPKAGKTDDTRCFVIDWPLQKDSYVTAMNVVPGNRRILHHLILAVVTGAAGDKLRKLQGKDGQPGYPCPGGAFGADVTKYIGGGVGGNENPRGIGTKIEAGSKLVLQIHYSTVNDPTNTATDQTSVELRIDNQAREAKAIVITNPFWVVGDAMRVKAGDPDVVYFYRYRPVLFTAKKRVLIEGASPHMHAFGSRFLLGIIHANGQRECVLEIPHWHFGWEQGYWLTTPKTLEPNDQVYVECHFDNSAEKQPIVNGVRAKPRDFAWGGDNQDMCAGFLSFTELP